jgi:hypothetical protein
VVAPDASNARRPDMLSEIRPEPESHA